MKTLILSLGLLGFLTAGTFAEAAKPTVTVYKSPTCGCCTKWAEHIRAAGYPVELKNTEALSVIKRMTGVPDAFASCHTATVEGYVLEGHVPAEAIDRILAERPDIAGIAVPGMPSGSPGMENGDFDAYEVLTFQGGSTSDSTVLMSVPGK